MFLIFYANKNELFFTVIIDTAKLKMNSITTTPMNRRQRRQQRQKKANANAKENTNEETQSHPPPHHQPTPQPIEKTKNTSYKEFITNIITKYGYLKVEHSQVTEYDMWIYDILTTQLFNIITTFGKNAPFFILLLHNLKDENERLAIYNIYAFYIQFVNFIKNAVYTNTEKRTRMIKEFDDTKTTLKPIVAMILYKNKMIFQTLFVQETIDFMLL